MNFSPKTASSGCRPTAKTRNRSASLARSELREVCSRGGSNYRIRNGELLPKRCGIVSAGEYLRKASLVADYGKSIHAEGVTAVLEMANCSPKMRNRVKRILAESLARSGLREVCSRGGSNCRIRNGKPPP